MASDAGGRLFFTNSRRGLVDEDEIKLVSIGIDIGSSTTHLAFSRITLERVDAFYIISNREVLFESEILLTPYAVGNTINTDKLSIYFQTQYQLAGIAFDQIDTGALILTGTAVRRNNARAIADLFAQAAGKFVSVSAGDGMEAVLSASGSGALALSAKNGQHILNIDIGGGTTKIARCANGEIIDLTAIDIGARLLAMDAAGHLTRLEPAGQKFAAECGISLKVGMPVSEAELEAITEKMTECLMEALLHTLSDFTKSLHRLAPLTAAQPPPVITFSGGVAEYIYGRSVENHGDLGPRLARKIIKKVKAWGPEILSTANGIRATVIGASQYTVQISGSTIFISDLDMLPLRNIPTISPKISLESHHLDASCIAGEIDESLSRFSQADEPQMFALCYKWSESATFQRIDAFCRGVILAFEAQISRGDPLILIGDNDIGGLIGLHFVEELNVKTQIVSIDGVILKEFDFVDIGAMLEGSGSVPVVIKSLVFPSTNAIGQTKEKLLV